MRTLVPLASLSLASLLALSACNPWGETAYYDRVVWSDDDEQLALVELRFEERDPLDPLMGTTEKRNFRHQLFVSTLDGESPTAVGQERPGQNGADVFFMRTQGYVLLSSLSDDGVIGYARIDLDGGAEAPLPEPGFAAASRFALPSPDGAAIAQIGVEGTNAEVRFYDAAGLAALADAVTVTFANTPAFTFRPDGALVLYDGATAQALRPGEAPVDTEVPTCFGPMTTSSDVSSRGVRVFLEEGGVTTRNEGEEASFGCE